MVEVSDFHFVDNFALENELPYYITGFINQKCETYVPPPGYIIVSCIPIESTLIGGMVKGTYKIRLGQESFVNSRNLTLIFGGIIIIVLGIAAVIVFSPPHLTY